MNKEIRDSITRDWQESPYYEMAETKAAVDVFWSEHSPFRRLFGSLDLTHVLELACGRGRHSEEITKKFTPKQLTLVDVNKTNISACKKRFKNDKRFTFVINSGSDLSDVSDSSVSSVVSYDAMVHFEYDDVFAYLREIYRVLKPGGRALLHHSNNDRQPGNLYHQSTHWRNFMSVAIFKHVAMRTGFSVEEQIAIDWGSHEDGGRELDAISLIRKPF